MLGWTPSLFNSLANSLDPTSQLRCLNSIPIKKQNQTTSESPSILDLSSSKERRGFPAGTTGKEHVCQYRKQSLGSGRSPGGVHGNPLQVSCLENPVDKGAWRALVHCVTESLTRLKRLSTHRERKFIVTFRSAWSHVILYQAESHFSECWVTKHSNQIESKHIKAFAEIVWWLILDLKIFLLFFFSLCSLSYLNTDCQS